MSRPRKEKNCLNCGHDVEELYCPHCGQKNVETHVNAFHAIGEFIGDYFHADGKFLKSIVPLLFRPGYMTNEYNAGRREKFINPFRLYIFVSIVYFSIAYLSPDSTGTIKSADPASKTNARIRLGNSGIIAFQRTDSTDVQDDSTINVLNERAEKLPVTIQQYRDSVKMLASENKPSYSDDIVNRVAIKYKAAGDAEALIGETLKKFQNTLPKLLFFLLPLAALLLKLFYTRRKKFYVDHLVHTLHLHSFIFLLLIIYSLIHLLISAKIIFAVAILWMIVYFFISMKRVYGQSMAKTIFKGFLFSCIYLFFQVCIFGAGFLYIFFYD